MPNRLLMAFFVSAGLVQGQSISNKSLTGKYFFRDVALQVSTISSALGAITFDGNGKYSVSGQQNVDTAAAAALSASGTYTVDSAGIVSLTSPLRPGVALNARLGSGALIAAATEPDSGADVFEVLVALPAGTGGSAANFNGSYFASAIEFPRAGTPGTRSSFVTLTADGAGGLKSVAVTGHADNRSDEAPFQESLNGGTYTVGADGSGTINAPGSALLAASKVLYVSADGSLFLAGSTTAGAHDLMVGVKQISGGVTNAKWTDRYWQLQFGVLSKAPFTAAGSENANGAGKLIGSSRVRFAKPRAPIDSTALQGYSLAADGSGTLELQKAGLGSAGNAYVTANVATSDPSSYVFSFGIRLPPATGSGVFLNPQGVLNTASFAPVGAPIAPGEFLALFGSGLAAATQTAQAVPFPTSLGGVIVTINGTPAPLYFVSSGQISVLAPFGLQGPTAAIVVNNNNSLSNTVTVPVAKTAPGIFALDQSGTGNGAILHANFGVVNGQSPAKAGETILIFLTGLGTVTPPVGDGAAGPSSPLSTSVTPQVLIGGQVAQVLFSGLAPGFAGLYQLNVTIPTTAGSGASIPVAIVTGNAVHDQVSIAIQ